jgi:hypothetical protein
MKLTYLTSTLLALMFARGCGNCVVGEYGNLVHVSNHIGFIALGCAYVNIMCRGTPNRSAMWGGAKLGGLAMMASHTNGNFSPTRRVSHRPPSQRSTRVSYAI